MAYHQEHAKRKAKFNKFEKLKKPLVGTYTRVEVHLSAKCRSCTKHFKSSETASFSILIFYFTSIKSKKNLENVEKFRKSFFISLALAPSLVVLAIIPF